MKTGDIYRALLNDTNTIFRAKIGPWIRNVGLKITEDRKSFLWRDETESEFRGQMCESRHILDIRDEYLAKRQATQEEAARQMRLAHERREKRLPELIFGLTEIQNRLGVDIDIPRLIAIYEDNLKPEDNDVKTLNVRITIPLAEFVAGYVAS